jgi:hypothetical protein
LYSLKAIITVDYGKELRASLEIGDTLYPYDNLVRVGCSSYGGVLLLYTSLTYEDVVNLLRKSKLVYVKSITKVDICCPDDKELLMRCISEYLSSINAKVGKIKIYERGNLKKYLRDIYNFIKSFYERNSRLKLYIAPVDYKVCIGLTVNEV